MQLITNFLQRLSRSVAGYNSGKSVAALFGATDSGKTNIVNCMKKNFGRYVASASGSTLHKAKANNDPSQFIWLVQACANDARLFCFNEIGDNAVYDGERIKQLSSGGGDGGDTMQIRSLFQMPFEFVPNFTMLLVGNSHPVIEPDDTYNRIAAFEMDTQFVEPDQLPGLAYGRPKDATLKSKITTDAWKAAFTFLVLSNYSTDEPPIHPACVIQGQPPAVAHAPTATPAGDLLLLIFEPALGAFTTNDEIMRAINEYCNHNDLSNHPLAAMKLDKVARMLKGRPGPCGMLAGKVYRGPPNNRKQHRGLENCQIK